MPNRVDTVMQPVEGAARQPSFDGPSPDPVASELPPPNDAVLTPGYLRQELVDSRRWRVLVGSVWVARAAFSVDMTGNAARIGHGTKSERRQRTCGALRSNLSSESAKRDSSPPVPPLALIP